jgi:protein-disulfide isomerase
VRDGITQGMRLGVNSTPTVFVNGRRISGAQPYDVFAAVIDEELSRK